MATVTKITTKPDWFKSKLLRSSNFTELFEDFEIPNNKLFIWNGLDRKESIKNPSYKGWTVVDRHGEDFGKQRKPGTPRCYFIYDGTLTGIANSHGYPSVGAHWQNATDDGIAASIAALYMGIFDPNYEYNYLDGEFEKGNDPTAFARVIKQLGIKAHESYPNIKIGWWAKGHYVGHPFWLWQTNEQWREHYNVPVPTIGDYFPGWAFESWDISEVDGYAMDMSYPPEQMYNIFQSHEVGRKFNNNQKYITTWWEQQEVSNHPTKYYRDVPGFGVKEFVSRPPKTACYSYNTGLAHASCLNGLEHWEAPFNNTLDKEFYYTGNDNDLNMDAANQNAFYKEEINLQTNWLVLGMYHTSLPGVKEIIEISDEWNLPDFYFNGELITGDNKYPSFSRRGVVKADGIPIIRLKYNNAKTECLIYANYPCNPSATDSIQIRVVDGNLDEVVTIQGGWADMFIVKDIISSTPTDCGSTEANPHECGGISEDGTHHGYYDSLTNKALGIFVSHQGEYKIYNNQWNPTIYLGTNQGKRYVGYKESYSGSAIVYTRTRNGCIEFADGHCNTPRPIEISTFNHNYKTSLNINQNHTGNVIDFNGFYIASNLGNVAVQDIYIFDIYNAPTGLQWSVDGSPFQSFSYNGSKASIPNAIIAVNKDYILELKSGGNLDKFVVRTNTSKGHFSNTTTMTRLRDGVVFICTFTGEQGLPSYLKYDNQTKIQSIVEDGTSFKINSLLGDTIVTLGFQETNVDWIDVKLLNKNN